AGRSRAATRRRSGGAGTPPARRSPARGTFRGRSPRSRSRASPGRRDRRTPRTSATAPTRPAPEGSPAPSVPSPLPSSARPPHARNDRGTSPALLSRPTGARTRRGSHALVLGSGTGVRELVLVVGNVTVSAPERPAHAGAYLSGCCRQVC